MKAEYLKEYLDGKHFIFNVKTHTNFDEKNQRGISAHGSLTISANLSDKIDLIFCFLFYQCL